MSEAMQPSIREEFGHNSWQEVAIVSSPTPPRLHCCGGGRLLSRLLGGPGIDRCEGRVEMRNLSVFFGIGDF
jgi:hypothetical protein